MTLRVVHVVRQYAPSVGGLEAVVANLASLQQQRFGYDVRVVTLDRVFKKPDKRLAAFEHIDGIPVTRLAWRGSSRYPLCPQVLGALGDADLVHVHGIDFFFDYLAATRWLHGRPMVASTHGGFFHSTFASTAKRIWFNTVSRLSSLGYRRIVATSDNDGVLFGRIAPTRVTVVENGADIALFRDAASRSETPTLIYFGRWSVNKGIPQLIATLAALRQRQPAWTLLLAGRPYDLQRTDIEALTDQHGVTAAVDIHESPSNATLRTLIGRASYFACLSRHEGFGIAAIEGMSAGLVPLLSDIPPFRKIVEASGSGVLLDRADPVAAAGAIIEWRERRRESSEERRSLMAFTERYDWSMVAERYDEVYRAARRDSLATTAPVQS